MKLQIKPSFASSFSPAEHSTILGKQIFPVSLREPDFRRSHSDYLLYDGERKGEKLETARQNLLDYCQMDTFAMVRIVEKLRELIG